MLTMIWVKFVTENLRGCGVISLKIVIQVMISVLNENTDHRKPSKLGESKNYLVNKISRMLWIIYRE